MRRLYVKQNAETKSRRGLSANQNLINTYRPSRVFKRITKVRLYFNWNSDKRTHSLTMKRNE